MISFYSLTEGLFSCSPWGFCGSKMTWKENYDWCGVSKRNIRI